MESGLSPQPERLSHAQVRQLMTEASAMTSDARLQSQIDEDYYHGDQRTAAERKALAERGQPDSVWNRIRLGVNGILGVVQRSVSEPRAYPRTPHDDQGADVVTDVLRFIVDETRFAVKKGLVFRDMLAPGTGAVRIGVDAERQVTIDQIRWEELFYDPRSRQPDFSDARYLGVAKWMFADDVAALYPDRREEVNGVIDNGAMVPDQTFEDRPDGANQIWVDRRQRRLFVVDLYYREATGWRRYVFHAGGMLEAGPSPYQDQRGRPTCPIEAQSIYVDRKNYRHGVVRDMRGPQDEINKRRSKALHLISVSQIQPVAETAQIVNVEEARREAARPDGVIPMGYQRAPTGDMASGHVRLLSEAKDEIERQGVSPAVLGRQSADASGRSVLARQQAGLTELAPVLTGLEDWELRVLRQMWARVRQFWTAPMYIRVTDDEGAPRFVGLNQPVGPELGRDPVTGEAAHGPAAWHPQTGPDGLPHPLAGQSVFGYRNRVAEMDVDIRLDTTPDTANIQAEQFQALVQLAANPAYAGQIPFETMLKLSATPHKREIVDAIKTFREEQSKTQVAQQQLAMAQVQARIAEAQSRAALNSAKAGQAEASTALDAHREGRLSVDARGGSDMEDMRTN